MQIKDDFSFISRVVFLSFGLQAFSCSSLYLVRSVLFLTGFILKRAHGARVRFSLGTDVNISLPKHSHQDLGPVPVPGYKRDLVLEY